MFLFRRDFSYFLYISHVLKRVSELVSFKQCTYIFQIVVQQVFESDQIILRIYSPILFLREVIARSAIPMGPNFSTKRSRSHLRLIAPFLSGNISRFLLYKNNCQTISACTSCVYSSELKFRLVSNDRILLIHFPNSVFSLLFLHCSGKGLTQTSASSFFTVFNIPTSTFS